MDRSGLLTLRKQLVKRVILSAVTLFIIAFIFANSATDADSSSQSSTSVMDLLNGVLKFCHINIMLSEHFVRKLAHFVEYFILGISIFFTVRSFNLRKTYCVFTVPLLGFAVASIDETIQLFSSGRSCQFSDVMLDFVGVTIAVFIMTAFSYITNKKDRGILK